MQPPRVVFMGATIFPIVAPIPAGFSSMVIIVDGNHEQRDWSTEQIGYRLPTAAVGSQSFRESWASGLQRIKKLKIRMRHACLFSALRFTAPSQGHQSAF